MIFVYMISTVFIILIQNMQSKSHKDFYKASTFLSDNYIKIEGTNKSGIREFLKEADKMTAENLILLDMGEGRMAVKYKDDSKFKLHPGGPSVDPALTISDQYIGRRLFSSLSLVLFMPISSP